MICSANLTTLCHMQSCGGNLHAVLGMRRNNQDGKCHLRLFFPSHDFCSSSCSSSSSNVLLGQEKRLDVLRVQTARNSGGTEVGGSLQMSKTLMKQRTKPTESAGPADSQGKPTPRYHICQMSWQHITAKPCSKISDSASISDSKRR